MMKQRLSQSTRVREMLDFMSSGNHNSAPGDDASPDPATSVHAASVRLHLFFFVVKILSFTFVLSCFSSHNTIAGLVLHVAFLCVPAVVNYVIRWYVLLYLLSTPFPMMNCRVAPIGQNRVDYTVSTKRTD